MQDYEIGKNTMVPDELENKGLSKTMCDTIVMLLGYFNFKTYTTYSRVRIKL